MMLPHSGWFAVRILMASNDFYNQFHFISNKLKKRFLRKPNLAEAYEQFSALANDCERNEIHQYAGLCWLAAAKCQRTLENITLEIDLLVKAGREFLKAQRKYIDLEFHLNQEENVQGAIDCFYSSMERLDDIPGCNVVAAGLAIELALAVRIDSSDTRELREAVEIFPTPKAMSLLIGRYIKRRDYVSAVNLLNKLVEFVESNTNFKNNGYYLDILHRSEASKVLLLLILQKVPPYLAQVLEKYAWPEEGKTIGYNMCRDEVLILQSLVSACQSKDYEAIELLEPELHPYLNTEQKGLLSELMLVMNK